MSSEDRRAAIIRAVRRVFAEKGFDGTKTRELAEAAGVSERSLFKHFPNKEALYSAMQISCCSEQTRRPLSGSKRSSRRRRHWCAWCISSVAKVMGREVTAKTMTISCRLD